jgi:hypothetical protein
MKLTPEKMRWLIDRLLLTTSPTTCPHGRPVILRLSMKDIERGFHRNLSSSHARRKAGPTDTRRRCDGSNALNMIDMIGVGPFITIPLIIAAMGGRRQCWVDTGALLVMCEVWSGQNSARPCRTRRSVFLPEKDLW